MFSHKSWSSAHITLVMKLTEYEAVVTVAHQNMFQNNCIKILKKEFPGIPEGTLMSIYAQLYQQYTKTVHGSHRKPERMKEYYHQYTQSIKPLQEGGKDAVSDTVLLDMAHQVKFSPALFARIILEEYINTHGLLPPGSAGPSSLVSLWMKSPSKIPDTLLQTHVKTCIVNDKNYGPLAENIKHSIGYEHEFLLKDKVEALGVPYMDEKDLRIRGYDKTPDFKLEVPFYIGDYVVNWIESKASFGDSKSHEKYLEDQYWSYQNRFGSGLVIYWYGFVEELDTHAAQGIRLMDHFPEDAHTLPDSLDRLLELYKSKTNTS